MSTGAPELSCGFAQSPKARAGVTVPRRNYGFEKRQKELAKLQKREAKRLRREERAAESHEASDPAPPDSPPGEQGLED
jgi:hypothetical protein